MSRPIFLRTSDYECGHPCLHRNQVRALNVLRGESYHKSQAARDELTVALSKCAYPDGTDISCVTDMVGNYVANEVPIVLHWRAESVRHFHGDTHYRNLFETSRGNGCTDTTSRHMHESAAFLELYNDATPFERPKYGAMNVFRDPAGVRPALGYGRCHFELAPHVRRRCTLNAGDTFGAKNLGTVDHCNHVLAAFSIQEMQALADAAMGNTPCAGRVGVYREVQIHGELRFDTDFSRVIVDDATEPDLHATIVEFATMNRIPVTTVHIGK